MLRCAISPDAQYLVSGSEDGKPRIWNTTMEEMMPTKPFECRMLDLVSDVQWNPRYNMFALSGFGQHFPVLIYVYQRTKEDLDRILLSGAGVQMGTDRAIEWEEARRNEAGINFDDESNMGGNSRRGGTHGMGSRKFSRRSVHNKSYGGSEFERSGRVNRSFGAL